MRPQIGTKTILRKITNTRKKEDINTQMFYGSRIDAKRICGRTNIRVGDHNVLI